MEWVRLYRREAAYSSSTPILSRFQCSLYNAFPHSGFYTFPEGDVLGQFNVKQVQEEWKIVSKKPLDREDIEKYLLKVTASDGKFQAVTEVEIFVLDINDNNPECKQVRRSSAQGGKGTEVELMTDLAQVKVVILVQSYLLITLTYLPPFN